MASSLDQKPCARCGDPNHAILYCNPNKKFTTRSWPTAQDEEKHKCERKFHDAMKKKGVERQRLMLEAIKDLSPPAQPPTTIPIRSGPASAANGSAPIVAQIVAKVSPSPSPAIRLEEDPSRPMNEILDADASSDHLDAIQRFRAKLSSFAAVKKANFESTDIHCMRTAFASADIPEGQKNLEHPNPKRVATRVFTNHFDVTLQPGTVLYEYTIVPINSTLSRAKKRLLVKSFIENCPTLKNNIGKFATDYVSTVIAWESLHNLQEYDLESDVDHAEVTSYTSGEKDSGVPLQLFLRFTNCWPTNTLQNYVDGQPDATTMMSVKEESPLIKAFNTIILETLQDPANSSWKALQTNEKKYFTERGWGKLGDNGTLHAHRGYSLTVRPAMGRILLNLNTATSAFFPAWPLRRFIHHLQVAYGNKEQAYAALKGLRVYINFERGQSSDGTPLGAQALNQPTRRIKSITGVGLPPAQQDFIIDEETEETVFVKDYFEGSKYASEIKNFALLTVTEYKRKLLHLELPCINVGSEARETWFAPELLEILPYQIFRHKIPGALAGDMISKAARTPALNKRLIIGERLRTLGIHANRPAKSFGSTSKLQSFIPHANRICATQAAGKISISPDMITIPAIKLPAPTVLYRGKPKKANAKAQWTLAAVKLDHIPKITIKIHVVFWELHATTDRFIIDQFVNEMKECGFDRPVRNEQWYDVAKSGSDVKKALQQAVNNHCNLVIMVFGQKDVDIYSRFKHVAEQQFGLNTLCLCQDKAEECRKKAAEKRPDRLLMEYMSNVGLKVNLKIGGINHQVQGLGTYLPDTMIIGADVTHPGAGAVGGVPSIAAVVASTDATAGRYLGSMRLQPKANDEVSNQISLLNNPLTNLVNQRPQRNGGGAS